jgi:hypothetical protein
MDDSFGDAAKTEHPAEVEESSDGGGIQLVNKDKEERE